MVAASIAVQALLPVHVGRFAVQKKRPHRRLRVAAVVEKRIKVTEKRFLVEDIAGAPPSLLESRLDLLARAHEHQVHHIRIHQLYRCLLYTSPSPRDRTRSRMPSSA